MLQKSVCLLLLILATAFGQDEQFSHDFGPFPKHAFNTVQGAVHITLHRFAASADWAMAVNAGNKAQVTVTRATIGAAPFVNKDVFPPQIPVQTVVDMQEWKDVRVADGLIEINNLDGLRDAALAITLTVPAGTNIMVQNDNGELYSGQLERALMVKNGSALPNSPNGKAIANVLVPLTLP